jgi:hypothetical protein
MDKGYEEDMSLQFQMERKPLWVKLRFSVGRLNFLEIIAK